VKKAVIIGAGFSGISAASFMAKNGWDVTVIEKNSTPGGRARQFEVQGFKFDMGPSWYWMPDIFERYFQQFGKSASDYYELTRLDPSYRVFWEDDITDLPADYESLKEFFEITEPGSAVKLDQFLKEAEYKYEVGIGKLVFKPGQSLKEFLDWELFSGMFKLDVFTSMKNHIGRFFKSRKLQQLLEFPVLFLGALPDRIPALYSLMNYADMKLGTWYPKGGFYSVISGMYELAKDLGVKFCFEQPASIINIEDDRAVSVSVKKNDGTSATYAAGIVIGSADYKFIETALLGESNRNYSEGYWNKKEMAPSCLIYYLGINKKLNNLRHHNLFFDTDFNSHGKDIYDNLKWPGEPLFYVCVPSITDDSVAPAGMENLFILIPVAAGLAGDDQELREKYFKKVLARLEERTGETIMSHIIYNRSYSVSDFVDDYNAFKGNAYGLANTIKQTANLKPSMRNKRIKNLFYTGQLTVPGPGVPPSLISGEVVAEFASSTYKKMNKNQPA
jgi:phytoene desaturase